LTVVVVVAVVFFGRWQNSICDFAGQFGLKWKKWLATPLTGLAFLLPAIAAFSNISRLVWIEHMMCFQSENTVFKCLRRIKDGP